ncbi:biotin transporter BioY [Gordonia desulfuricans]|uniref:Biotin transporter BioY n=1 Tax=Gordonia desulfuricans TaxID=89051 RepID=A0A7K3LNA7_9ACTN|nr:MULTISPECIES: biotin transporter BioY [Gordonia]EMP11437.2 biotin biosynthesis protein BioY [Gordonia sp. NB41Y]NDK89037.1 biotin transporter BioY [Gordonia desulfuricans]WLP91577.1 biotin transporter BioY [Gordonia sp. NB41Y]
MDTSDSPENARSVTAGSAGSASGRFSLGVADLTQAAVFAALIAALGLPGTINLGSSGVPITFQTLGVMLAGAVLGPKKGTLAVVIFMVLALAGLPILSGGRNGQTALLSPTAGYFIGFLPAVIVIGVLTALMMPRYRVVWGALINLFGGMVVVYACGVIGLLVRTDLTLWAAVSTNGTFIIGDVIKAVVAALVAAQVHRSWPGLITPWRSGKRGPTGTAGVAG